LELKKKIKQIFLTGLVVTIPVGVTIYILFFLITLMDGLFLLIPKAYHPDNFLGFHIPGLGVIVMVMLILICGLITKSYIGKRAVTAGENLVNRIPVVGSIYRATKQVVDGMFADRGRSFKKVVLLEFPRKGMYTVGFVTGHVEGALQKSSGSGNLCVFVPTTPMPTNGYFLIVPERDVIPSDMSVEEAFTLVMSCGIVLPALSPGGAD
jgi:uncharacterized membrane protein